MTVHKKDVRVHLCGDYRKVNKVTADDGYYIPRPDKLIDRMGNAKYISTLDMIKRFYQVPMSDRDKEKTVFITPLGKFQFQRMPFGLKMRLRPFKGLSTDFSMVPSGL